jgi:hypothetical protein
VGIVCPWDGVLDRGVAQTRRRKKKKGLTKIFSKTVVDGNRVVDA